ncbi:LysE family translocator [Aquimarina sp. MMG016]|uniref:LysE family translocator n=1 Tax=Aquimarina sp. MMG016 TaxID=2822690 RepID=UPI001B39D1D9|nr:LysE family translocator [Aquimarina sp. MMG016]MBQ4819267.1 LysE family translocator [Aquimarina sp. MMG016]
MFGIINFSTFLIAGIILNLTPGADTMYILGRSISQGKKSGIISALGIASGAILHCVFAALGLSILLAKSALAFDIVKYTGALYLIYLGVISLLSKSKANTQKNEEGNDKKIKYSKIYISGVFTNLLNPKVALFFLAFLPQFINPNYAKDSLPFLILGITFVLTGTIWCLVLALFSARLASMINRNPKVKLWLTKTTGGLFILLGIQMVLQD